MNENEKKTLHYIMSRPLATNRLDKEEDKQSRRANARCLAARYRVAPMQNHRRRLLFVWLGV